ncbi:MAG: alpha/beta hydrolase [Pseudomonadota bacterium]
MAIVTQMADRAAPMAQVIALHCSGANGRQWRQLGSQLEPTFAFAAPDHMDSSNLCTTRAGVPFSLADEAAATLDIIDASDRPIHLVGHSYGGAVALHVARMRPERIASMSLYEPTAFHLLHDMGLDGRIGHAEITHLSNRVARFISRRDFEAAAVCFVTYWGGEDAWQALRPEQRAALAQWAPKAVFDFEALLNEPSRLQDFSGLAMPILLMRGAHSPDPGRVIARHLLQALPTSRCVCFTDAGHMGPLTHATDVAHFITHHILAASGVERRAAA